jgi:hypothetical protein
MYGKAIHISTYCFIQRDIKYVNYSIILNYVRLKGVFDSVFLEIYISFYADAEASLFAHLERHPIGLWRETKLEKHGQHSNLVEQK